MSTDATRSAPQPAVKVKALEWTMAALDGKFGWLIVSYSQTPFGRYYVEKFASQNYRVSLNEQVLTSILPSSIDEAISAAQADYEQRIRSALISPSLETEPVEGEPHEFVADPYRPSQCVNCARHRDARIHDVPQAQPAEVSELPAKVIGSFDEALNEIADLDGLELAEYWMDRANKAEALLASQGVKPPADEVARDVDLLIEEYQNLVKTGAEYAASELRLAPTSAFEIYICHFRDIGRDIAALLSSTSERLKAVEAELGRVKLHVSAWEDSARINKLRADEAEAALTGAREALSLAEREITARIRFGLADAGMSAEEISALVDGCPAIIAARAALTQGAAE